VTIETFFPNDILPRRDPRYLFKRRHDHHMCFADKSIELWVLFGVAHLGDQRQMQRTAISLFTVVISNFDLMRID
jgi:hypothetical protein